ncbi:Ohr family peroxiredoxin [Bacillus subtilis]
MALFTAKVTARGGRAGHITSDDGVLDFDIVMPNAKKEGQTGTNPEQLFAAGYAACFGGALEHVAKEQNIEIDSEIEGQVSLIKDESDGGFKIGVTLVVNTKDLDREKAPFRKTNRHVVPRAPVSIWISKNHSYIKKENVY